MIRHFDKTAPATRDKGFCRTASADFSTVKVIATNDKFAVEPDFGWSRTDFTLAARTL